MPPDQALPRSRGSSSASSSCLRSQERRHRRARARARALRGTQTTEREHPCHHEIAVGGREGHGEGGESAHLGVAKLLEPPAGLLNTQLTSPRRSAPSFSLFLSLACSAALSGKAFCSLLPRPGFAVGNGDSFSRRWWHEASTKLLPRGVTLPHGPVRVSGWGGYG
jgi:hypothetical protein